MESGSSNDVVTEGLLVIKRHLHALVGIVDLESDAVGPAGSLARALSHSGFALLGSEAELEVGIHASEGLCVPVKATLERFDSKCSFFALHFLTKFV